MTELSKSERQWFLLDQARRGEEICRISEVLAAGGVKFLLIKGRAAADNYPENHPRSYSDIDIAVSERDFVGVSLEIASNPALSKIGIDLHRGVRHLDSLPWHNLLSRSVSLQIGKCEIPVPCPEDHLRIMAVHWLNDGGQYKERLWDIYYAVENRPDSFDWDECLGVVSPTRRKWVVTAIGLAHKYLGLNIDDLPFAKEAKQIPKWIKDCVEAEWVTDVRLRPLHTVWRDPKVLFQQIRKRVPPNPIQATIECEGEFDDSARLKYQLRSVLQRIPASARRISSTIFRAGRS